ncbi:hypothetical protein [Mesorhizobium sp. CAU 1732]|uniref:hypothetical protein n=1 Tax=Mesorhizobium sp. CAU 1732 TaxID=3140358 RepID=UPI0032609D2E
MKATVTKPFKGVKTGEVYPTQFTFGDNVDGNLAQVAVDNGWAVSDKTDATHAPSPPPDRYVERGGAVSKPRVRRGRKS